jgi:hypothetical protein
VTAISPTWFNQRVRRDTVTAISTTPPRPCLHALAPEVAWREHMKSVHKETEFGASGRPCASTTALERQDAGLSLGARPGQVSGPWGPLLTIQVLFGTSLGHEVIDDGHDGDLVRDLGLGQASAAAGDANGAGFMHAFDQLNAAHARRKVASTDRVTAPTSGEMDDWLCTAGFAQRLQGYFFLPLRALCDKPLREQNPVYQRSWGVTVSTMMKCHCYLGGVGDHLRNLLNRGASDCAPRKSLEGYKSDKETLRGATCMARLLLFSVRTQRQRTARDIAPPCHLDLDSTRAWRALEQALESPDPEPTAATTADSDCADGASSTGSLQRFLVVEKLVVDFIVALMQHIARADEAAELPLLVALTVMGIQPGKPQFVGPGDYGSTLSFAAKVLCCIMLASAMHTGVVDNAEEGYRLVARTLNGPRNNAMKWIVHKLGRVHNLGKAEPRTATHAWNPATRTALSSFSRLSVSRMKCRWTFSTGGSPLSTALTSYHLWLPPVP